MITAGRTIALHVDKPAAGGWMIARVDGQVVLVAGAIPGERVQARIDRVTRGVAYAQALTVDEPSPDRRQPFTDPLCGGSLYAHIAYPRQLAIKGVVVADAFRRIGRIDLPGDVAVAASPEDGYRMRARLHVRGRRIGFFREGTHDVCDARATRQLLAESCDVLDRLGAALRSLGGAEAVRDIELSENVPASERAIHFDVAERIDPRILERLAAVDGVTPGQYVTDTLALNGGTVTLRRHVHAFFQGNRYVLREFVGHVIELVPAGGRLLDLYAGVGLFATAAAVARDAIVTAVEGDHYAADDLQHNAGALAGQVRAVKRSVEHFLSDISARARNGDAESIDAAIVDPPRTGVSREALDLLLRVAVPRLVYVSCDVATLARDARRLVDAGYRITRADGFDLFPNTPHVETVVVFDR